MIDKKTLKLPFILFCLALLIRLCFYFLGLIYLPDNFQKFVTADTTFYYDPFALKAASGEIPGLSLLSATRITFLGYLSLFYRFFGHHHMPVSIFHCFLGALSTVFLFLTSRLFFKEKIAFTVGLVSAFQIVLVYWTPFVNSEALFFLILTLCMFVYSLFIKSRRPIYIFPLIICLVLVSVSRPLGITFAAFMVLHLEWLILKKSFLKNGRKCFYLGNLLILIIVIMLAAHFKEQIGESIKQPHPQELLNMSLYLDEMPGVKVSNGYLKAYGARLTLIPGISIPKAKVIPVQIKTGDIFAYFRDYPNKFLTLFILRVYTLFNPWVPEYSLRHNLLNVLFYGIIYVVSILGLVKTWETNRDFTILILLALLSQILLVGLTVMDYDFRFRLPIELILNIPVGVGLYSLFKIGSKRGVEI